MAPAYIENFSTSAGFWIEISLGALLRLKGGTTPTDPGHVCAA
jgi:hypothetical protein